MKRALLTLALVAMLASPAMSETIAGSPKQETAGLTTTALEVVHYGKYRIAPAGNEACMNVKLYESTPPVLQDGDFWIENTPTTHKICFRASGSNICRSAVAQ